MFIMIHGKEPLHEGRLIHRVEHLIHEEIQHITGFQTANQESFSNSYTWDRF